MPSSRAKRTKHGNTGLVLIQADNSAVEERVAERWDMSLGLPLPRWDVDCPLCAGAPQIRMWQVGPGGSANHPYRCVVHMKCRACSAVWAHALVIPQPVHAAAMAALPRGQLRYDKALANYQATGSLLRSSESNPDSAEQK